MQKLKSDKETYDSMYDLDVYAIPQKVEHVKDRTFQLTIKIKEGETKKLLIKQTPLVKMIWEQYERRFWDEIEKTTGKKPWYLPHEVIVGEANEVFADKQYKDKYLRFVADFEGNINFVAGLNYVPITEDSVLKSAEYICKKQGVLQETGEKSAIAGKFVKIPLNLAMSPEAAAVTEGARSHLLIDAGNNFKGQSLTFMFGYDIKVCANGLIMGGEFFGDKEKIRHISSIHSFNDESKRKKFFEKFGERLKGIIDKISEFAKQYDEQIVASHKDNMELGKQKAFIDRVGLPKYLYESTLERLKKEEETRWGLSQALTWIASHEDMRAVNTAKRLQVMGGLVVTDKGYVARILTRKIEQTVGEKKIEGRGVTIKHTQNTKEVTASHSEAFNEVD